MKDAGFNSGVVDTRTPDELMTLVTSKLDMWEVIQTMEYVQTKFAEEKFGKYDTVEEMQYAEAEEAMGLEPEKSAIDITLNLNLDYFRVIRFDQPDQSYKYSVICQVDAKDNLVWDYITEPGQLSPAYEALIDKLQQFGTGKFKAIGETKYLLNGGKNQENPEFDRSMLLKKG
jgi:hypothetical protein